MSYAQRNRQNRYDWWLLSLSKLTMTRNIFRKIYIFAGQISLQHILTLRWRSTKVVLYYQTEVQVISCPYQMNIQDSWRTAFSVQLHLGRYIMRMEFYKILQRRVWKTFVIVHTIEMQTPNMLIYFHYFYSTQSMHDWNDVKGKSFMLKIFMQKNV